MGPASPPDFAAMRQVNPSHRQNTPVERKRLPTFLRDGRQRNGGRNRFCPIGTRTSEMCVDAHQVGNRLLAERAAEWLCRLETADLDEKAQFVNWLKQSPAHVREMLLAMA